MHSLRHVGLHYYGALCRTSVISTPSGPRGLILRLLGAPPPGEAKTGWG